MDRQSFENVWDALEDTPSEAMNMSMRSSLLIAIEQQVRGWNVTQAEAARSWLQQLKGQDITDLDAMRAAMVQHILALTQP